MNAQAQASPAPRAPAWKRWGLAAMVFYALKGIAWMILGWTVLGD